VVLFFAAIRSSNENVLGSDFTSQYRRSPGVRGVNTAAHAPPSWLGADFFGAAFFDAGFFDAAFFVAAGFVPAYFVLPGCLPRLDAVISCPHLIGREVI
jgi:hypothetical protein